MNKSIIGVRCFSCVFLAFAQVRFDILISDDNRLDFLDIRTAWSNSDDSSFAFWSAGRIVDRFTEVSPRPIGGHLSSCLLVIASCFYVSPKLLSIIL